MTKDYRIEIKVKNNNILDKIEECGFKTVSEFCRINNIQNSTLGDIINMKETPLNKNGTFRKIVHDVADIFCCNPEDLFSEAQLQAELETNKHTLKVGEAEMRFMLEGQRVPLLPDESISKQEMIRVINESLETLTPREAKVLKERFGLDGEELHTLESSGKKHGVSRDRIRQIEAKALRKLRHPSRAKPLREFK